MSRIIIAMIPVTDEMVAAARRQIPERWGLSHLRDAITAALETAEQSPAQTFELRDFDANPLREEELGESVAAVNGAMGRPHLLLAGRCTVEPHITADGIVGGDVRDATGSAATIPVHHPELHPVLDRPLVLGGITEIASRLGAARSTVVGWIKRADKIGMPAPLAHLAAGPVFDLTAVEAWHKAWKAGDSADGEADT